MNRFEIIIRQKGHLRTVDAIARCSIDALLTAISAVRPQGAFTAVVRPFEAAKGGANG